MNHWLRVLLGVLFLVPVAAVAEDAPEALMLVRGAPSSGIIAINADFTFFTRAASEPLAMPVALKAQSLADGKDAPIQFVPDNDYDARTHATGMLLLKTPSDGEYRLRFRLEAGKEPEKQGLPFGEAMAKAAASNTHGKTLEHGIWDDRLYQSGLGQFWLRYDPAATLENIGPGPVCAVSRIRAHYCDPNGNPARGQPEVIYTCCAFQDSPLIQMSAVIRQNETRAWDELHFMEIKTPEGFAKWFGGDPRQEGAFNGSKTSVLFDRWAAISSGDEGFGMFGAAIRCYDGDAGFGSYLNAGWVPFETETRRMSAWLWLGGGAEIPEAVRQAADAQQTKTKLILTRADLHQRIEQITAQRNGASRFFAVQAADAEEAGQLDEATALSGNELPGGWQTFSSGNLQMTLQAAGDGIRLRSLFDLAHGSELLAHDTLPLFSMRLRGQAGKEMLCAADAGWNRVSAGQLMNNQVELTWEGTAQTELGGFRVTARAAVAGKDRTNQIMDRWDWSLRTEGLPEGWQVTEVTFPQVKLRESAVREGVLWPRASGILRRDFWNGDLAYSSRYPDGWCAMQFMAAFAAVEGEETPSGFYFALHDNMGSTKELMLRREPNERAVRMAFELPAPIAAQGNDYLLPGTAVWQTFRGDWFDAARLYKEWLRGEAHWWPQTGQDGREDTPLWMRELCAWTQTSGTPEEVMPRVKAFAEYLGVPVGFHWYCWHQIPFDNDYPHYFPPKEGFAAAVKELQEHNVFVMPYINGRLWDTHDKGAEDFEFTKVALPAAAKQEDGQPFIESYGSKEADGNKVRLAVMCPTAPLWQKTVKETVLRLQNEMGCKGVYIDQIAAASPVLCMDASHGHPLGGGWWWNKGYWDMLDSLRKDMAEDRMITTECNGEPFASKLDGYLTWHWQYDGMVPAFPAIYGGALQMFGRSYGGGATRDLALRMRAAQQLTFGEQIGWLDPDVINEPENAPFFKQAVQMRWRLRRYFYAGEMERPPRLAGGVPSVKADWQWGGECWVTTPAVLTGAWALPQDGKAALIFANVSDAPVDAAFTVDYRACGLEPRGKTAFAPRAQVLRDKESPGEPLELKEHAPAPLHLPPRTILCWEIETR